MMPRYRWIEWHTRHSSGNGSTHYLELDVESFDNDEDALDDALASLEAEWSTGTEHWRGVGGKFIDTPPLDWLVKEQKNLQHQVYDLIEKKQRIIDTLLKLSRGI